MRQYGRNDVEYKDWYSDWMKRLARRYSYEELSEQYEIACGEAYKHGMQHLKAIQKSTSMTGNSQHRAQARNCVAASGEYKIALSGAIEIHELFPEHAKNEIK